MIKREIINPDKTYKWGWSLCTYIHTNKYKWYWHLCIHGEKNEREKETQIKIKIKIQILTSLYGEYHSNGWAPGPPAPLGSAWRPQSVIWNIIFLIDFLFLFDKLLVSLNLILKYDAMWNPLVCHEKSETNYLPREIFWWPSSIFFISLCIPYEILHSFLYHANALPFFKSFFSPSWYFRREAPL